MLDYMKINYNVWWVFSKGLVSCDLVSPIWWEMISKKCLLPQTLTLTLIIWVSTQLQEDLKASNVVQIADPHSRDHVLWDATNHIGYLLVQSNHQYNKGRPKKSDCHLQYAWKEESGRVASQTLSKMVRGWWRGTPSVRYPRPLSIFRTRPSYVSACTFHFRGIVIRWESASLSTAKQSIRPQSVRFMVRCKRISR